MEVRVARAEDLPALLALLEELPANAPPAPTERLTVPAAVADVWPRILSQAGRVVLVAVDGVEVVGTADFLIVPNLTHGGAPWAAVENVVVRGMHRRQGVGRALMDAVLTRARAGGCYKVQLLSNEARTGAHAFYRALGFQTNAQGFRYYF